ncbi:SGNH/GDSL hydrolase family protein [Arthrobacter antioxidans]|uniref:SGNH/GDSL hydrolase family protein n=1 Tax=Arthrobacter antioxidans TaxID=2895818 RepID=UPI001FFFCE2C|nr:SGNH/GDSL hydrolase family protein [Arthrobacter antioxidans]
MNRTKHSAGIRPRLVALAAAATAALIGGTAGPVAAAPPAPLSYVALGDSYASGFGAGSYVNACGQTPLGLPGILDTKKQVELVADATCAGAKAATEAGGALDLPEQVGRVVASGALSPSTDLVTISAGGNDAGFGQVAGVCATRPTAECEQFIAAQNATALPALGCTLDALYSTIGSAAPHATVVVTGYPHLFTPEAGTPVLLPVASQTAFNDGTDAVNAVIRSRAEAHGFTFVDLVRKFEGHGLGSADPWITFRPGAVDNLHPTDEGYRSGYFPAVRSSVNFSRLQR